MTEQQEQQKQQEQQEQLFRSGLDLSTDTLVLGLGCFWTPEAYFGHLPGVQRTSVGYAGGTIPEQPTYRQLGDHSETVEIVFDPAQITAEELFERFWDRHNPANINGYKGRQYQSLILYRSSVQREAAERVQADRQKRGVWQPGTELAPLRTFTPAEDRHQKYYLKRFPDALHKLRTVYPSDEALHRSTLAARLNGLAKGFSNRTQLLKELDEWPLPPAELQQLTALVRGIKW